MLRRATKPDEPVATEAGSGPAHVLVVNDDRIHEALAAQSKRQ